MKYLIVTADDVGLHRGMTLGAIRAHREGIVTSCSVAATGRELDHAAELLSDCPALDVGVHLTLVEGRPLSDPASIPTLVTRDGSFLASYRGFAARHAIGQVSVKDVERELRAQIERVLAKGLSPCHLNGHQHIHVLPRVFDVVLSLAREYRIPYLRIPDDRVPVDIPIARRLALATLNRLARRAKDRTRAAGLLANDRTIGVADAGHLDVARLRQLVGKASSVTELVTHPGIDRALISRSFDWNYLWDAETAALCDPAIRETLGRQGTVLVGIRDLAAGSSASTSGGPTNVRPSLTRQG